jgi:hypothetical protein
VPAQIGRFVLGDRLGAGAFGAVYRAFDPHLRREVALKVPHLGTLDNPRAIERFLREATAAAQLRHPHIVQEVNPREVTVLGRQAEVGLLRPAHQDGVVADDREDLPLMRAGGDRQGDAHRSPHG